jgi:hypothetical protein
MAFDRSCEPQGLGGHPLHIGVPFRLGGKAYLHRGQGVRGFLASGACLALILNEFLTAMIGRHLFMRSLRNKGAIEFAAAGQLSPCGGQSRGGARGGRRPNRAWPCARNSPVPSAPPGLGHRPARAARALWTSAVAGSVWLGRSWASFWGQTALFAAELSQLSRLVRAPRRTRVRENPSPQLVPPAICAYRCARGDAGIPTRRANPQPAKAPAPPEGIAPRT